MHRLELRFDAPIYYLFCHALELTMKAFLRAKGMTAEELRSRDFGHKLLMLWQTCLEKGLHSPSSSEDYATQQVIEYLDPYTREFEFRYIQVGANACHRWNMWNWPPAGCWARSSRLSLCLPLRCDRSRYPAGLSSSWEFADHQIIGDRLASAHLLHKQLHTGSAALIAHVASPLGRHVARHAV